MDYACCANGSSALAPAVGLVKSHDPRKLGRMLDAAHLPHGIAALKAMLSASEARVAHLSAELSTRTAEIEHLKLVLASPRRIQFGRRSEKLDQQIEQLELNLEDLEAEAAVAEAQAPVEVAPRK
jgi:hypothetical protein